MFRRFQFKTEDETLKKKVTELLEMKQLDREEIYLLLSALEIRPGISERDL